jgi:hypothetical protein
VKREQGTLESLKAIPVPFEGMTDDELSRWALLHADAINIRPAERSLLDMETEGRKTAAEIDRELDSMTCAALSLSEHERWLVEDLTGVRIALDEGKLGERAVKPPKQSELKLYAQTLCSELDSFLDVGDAKHQVRVVYDAFSGMVRTCVSTGSGTGGVTIEKADGPTLDAFADNRKGLRREFRQWVYFDRKLVMLEGEATYLFKPLQRFHWTRGQALNDADLLIGETLTSKDS